MNPIAVLAVIIAAVIASNKASAAEIDTKSAVAKCVEEVHRQKPEFESGWFETFDAYVDPVTDRIRTFGAPHPTFFFEKCMALKGHSVHLHAED
jgi:hypothetical protein